MGEDGEDFQGNEESDAAEYHEYHGDTMTFTPAPDEKDEQDLEYDDDNVMATPASDGEQGLEYDDDNMMATPASDDEQDLERQNAKTDSSGKITDSESNMTPHDSESNMTPHDSESKMIPHDRRIAGEPSEMSSGSSEGYSAENTKNMRNSTSKMEENNVSATPKNLAHTVYIPHDVVVEECLERIQNANEKENPALQTLVDTWTHRRDTALAAKKDFEAESNKLQGEIEKLIRTADEVTKMTSPYDSSNPRLTHADEIEILNEAHAYISDLDEHIQNLKDKVKECEGKMKNSQTIEAFNIALRHLYDLKHELNEDEKQADEAYKVQVGILRSKKTIELTEKRNAENKQIDEKLKYMSLYNAHKRNQNSFSDAIAEGSRILTASLEEAEKHHKHVIELAKKHIVARSEMDKVGRDLCRASELLIVPHSTEVEYDSVVAQIMRKHGHIEEPPDFDGDWESKCPKSEGVKGKVVTPNLYQILPAYFASSDKSDNLLVYHDMGTGKTCTIVLMVLQMAVHQHNARIIQRKMDPTTGCLVLVQKDSAIPKYTAELRTCGLATLNDFQEKTGVWCTIDGADKGPDKKTIPESDNADIHRWSFYHKEPNAGRPFFVASFQSITTKYDPPKEVKGNLIRGELPTYVIVDEAHNLYDPSGLGAKGAGLERVKKYAKEFEAQIRDDPAPRSKVIFLTGTPTTGSLSALVDLLSLLGPSVRDALQAPLHGNVAKKEKQHGSSYEEKLIEKFFVKIPRKRMFEKQTVRPYDWNETEKKEIGAALKGKISYVTMVNDPRVFARFGIYLKVPIDPGGNGNDGDTLTLVPEKKSQKTLQPSHHAASGAVITQSEQGDTFEIDTNSLHSGSKYVLVKTRPQRSHEFKSANELKTYKFFVPYTVNRIDERNDILPAWKAVFSLVDKNKFLPDQGTPTPIEKLRFKHFFYYDKDSRNETRGFEDAFIKQFYPTGNKKRMKTYNNKYVIPSFGDIMKGVLGADCRPAALTKLIQAVNEFKEIYGGPLAVYLRKPKPADGKVERDDEKKNANLITMFECVYNSRENKDGHLIQYVFVSKDFKEGLSLFGTRFVHILSPPKTERALQQAVRRALRYCGMVYVENPQKNWFVTVLLYCSDYEKLHDSARKKIEKLDQTEQDEVLDKQRCERISKMKIMPGTDPVDIFLQMLKEYAVDCETLTPVNKVKCAKKSLESGKIGGCGQLWKRDGNWELSEAHKKCTQDLRLPSVEDETWTSMRDEVLRKLLEKAPNISTGSEERIPAPEHATGFDLNHDETPLRLFADLIDRGDNNQLANAVRIFLNERYENIKKNLSLERQNELTRRSDEAVDAFLGLKSSKNSISQKILQTNQDQPKPVNHRLLIDELREKAKVNNLIPKKQ